ncbi:hypothetical protein [Chthoniobacter flavus]|uniref:hypothetical protein n=1 Tax=Chthoniobacter flavus TaxID=191863 RepID=UPI0003001F90|nr:hypothetical protein [Chthoniobacter flavus]
MIFEPNQADLDKAVLGRDVSAGLAKFFENLLQRKKWVRKINIPSRHDDVAAVLLFTTTLKEGGLEILSELHIYCAGKTMIEKWEVAGEWQQIRSLPQESFQAIDITKVRVDGNVVSVDFTVPSSEGQSGLYFTQFDFSSDEPPVRTVPHPLLRKSI